MTVFLCVGRFIGVFCDGYVVFVAKVRGVFRDGNPCFLRRSCFLRREAGFVATAGYSLLWQ